jgi:hypothetical protein
LYWLRELSAHAQKLRKECSTFHNKSHD